MKSLGKFVIHTAHFNQIPHYRQSSALNPNSFIDTTFAYLSYASK